jgi:hypothetical protein
MKFRSTVFASAKLLGATLLAATAVGCLDDGDGGHERHGRRHHKDNAIVFGIDETKTSDGKVTTSVGYEMLDVLGHGSRARGIVTADRSCWSERLDDRLGQPHVAGGVAIFKGGLLPANGIAVLANVADDLKLEGAAWTNPGESLTFEAKGFAMPDISPSELVVPSLDLAIATPADAAAEVAVSKAQELEIGWTPSSPEAASENVVASLTAVPEGQPNARGIELRCFFDRTAGTGRFPQKMMDRFVTLVGAPAGSAIKGKLRIATHRQLTLVAKGGWTVYVVATAEQREQAFALGP